MYWGAIFTISLYFVNCGSTPITENIKQNLTLYQDNLLNENLLPFLKKCYNPNCCTENDDLLCPSYFELVRLFNTSNVIINETNQQLLAEIEKFSSDYAGKVDEFCEKIPKHIPEKSFYKLHQDMIHKAINDLDTCKLLCTNVEWTTEANGPLHTIKPLCSFILWMSNNLKEKTGANPDPKLVNRIGQVPLSNKQKDVKIVEQTSSKLNLTLEKAQNASITKQISNSTPNLVKSEQLTNSTLEMNNDSSKNVDVTTKTVSEEPQNQDKKIVEKQKEEQHGKPQDQQGKQPKQQQEPPEQQLQPHVQQDQQEQDINDLDGSQGDDINSSKNKQDLNTYSEDDEEEDDSTTNDILKSNFNFKDTKIETVKENFDQSIYEKNENTIISTDPFYEESGSNFFIYFLIAMFICMIAYVVYHNKSKLLALAIEGRRSQKGKTRRKHLAGYRKLDTNLEEAITSTSSGQVTQIIY